MQCLYIPAGYILAEASGHGILHYGTRKSFFPVSDNKCTDRYMAMCEALASGGADTAKMTEILAVLKKSVMTAA